MSDSPDNDDAASRDSAHAVPSSDHEPGRWYQFRLGTMMLVLTVFVVWLGWQMNRTQRHQAAVISIRQLGGQIRSEPMKPEWLRRAPVLRRMVVTESIVEIHFLGPRLGDDDVEQLADVVRQLPSLETLHFVESRVSNAAIDRLRQACPGLSIDRRDLVLEPTRSIQR